MRQHASPAGRQVVVGTFFGHTAILALAIGFGYGGTALLGAVSDTGEVREWSACLAMMASSLLLGAVFVALGNLISAVVRQRASAADATIRLWLAVIAWYEFVGRLLADSRHLIGQRIVSARLLTNPADADRIVNLTGSEQKRPVTWHCRYGRQHRFQTGADEPEERSARLNEVG